MPWILRRSSPRRHRNLRSRGHLLHQGSILGLRRGISSRNYTWFLWHLQGRFRVSFRTSRGQYLLTIVYHLIVIWGRTILLLQVWILRKTLGWRWLILAGNRVSFLIQLLNPKTGGTIWHQMLLIMVVFACWSRISRTHRKRVGLVESANMCLLLICIAVVRFLQIANSRRRTLIVNNCGRVSIVFTIIDRNHGCIQTGQFLMHRCLLLLQRFLLQQALLSCLLLLQNSHCNRLSLTTRLRLLIIVINGRRGVVEVLGQKRSVLILWLWLCLCLYLYLVIDATKLGSTFYAGLSGGKFWKRAARHWRQSVIVGRGSLRCRNWSHHVMLTTNLRSTKVTWHARDVVYLLPVSLVGKPARNPLKMSVLISIVMHLNLLLIALAEGDVSVTHGRLWLSLQLILLQPTLLHLHVRVKGGSLLLAVVVYLLDLLLLLV